MPPMRLYRAFEFENPHAVPRVFLSHALSIFGRVAIRAIVIVRLALRWLFVFRPTHYESTENIPQHYLPPSRAVRN